MPTNTLRCSCGCAADSAVPVFVRAQLYTLDYTVIPARNARNFAKKITQINKFFCPILVSMRSLCVFFDFFVNFRLSMHRFLHFFGKMTELCEKTKVCTSELRKLDEICAFVVAGV